MFRRRPAGNDEGAIVVVYAIVFVFVLAPLLALSTTSLVRSSTSGELQRAADAGSLAAAAEIPFGDVNFARNFLDATAGGPADRSLTDLGLSYSAEDPLQVACREVALPDATDASNTGHFYATQPTCHASYLSDLDTLVELRNCASATLAPVAQADIPDLSGLLPVLLYPGVQVTMSWTVKGPLDGILHGTGTTQSVTSIAHRRFKNMVVIPEAHLPVGKQPQTINLNPYAGDARNLVLDALDGSEKLLVASPATAPCATALDAAHDDILDAVDPPSGGPDAAQVLADAEQQGTPITVVEATTNALGIPYLDFVPVCVASSGNGFVGHLGDFGSCSIDAPGGFRADLRRS